MNRETQQALADETPLQRAFRLAGGPKVVIPLLDISRANYYQYFTGDRGKRGFPPEHCVAIEAHLDEPGLRRQLRPDDWWKIWPELVTEDFPIPIAEVEV